MDLRGRLLISAFIVIYFSFVWIWLLPDSVFKEKATLLIGPVLSSLCLEQRWTMFAPEVRNTNVNCTALVSFEDGSSKYYECPRMDLMGVYERFCRQKLNKTFLDGWERPNYRGFHPYLARFVARCNINPQNQPKMISLIMNWGAIPGIDHWVSRKEVPDNTQRDTYFVYKVQPEDLK